MPGYGNSRRDGLIFVKGQAVIDASSVATYLHFATSARSPLHNRKSLGNPYNKWLCFVV